MSADHPSASAESDNSRDPRGDDARPLRGSEAVDAERARRRKRRRTAIKWIKRVLIAAVAIALVGGLVWSFLPKPVLVDLATATRGPLTVSVREDGKTRVKHRYVISAPLTGNMLRISARPGDPVNAGDTLIHMVPTAPPLLDARTRAETQARLGAALASQRQARAQLEGARVAAEQAKSEAARLTGLGDRGLAATAQVEQAAFANRARSEELSSAEFAVKVANHQVELARASLGRLGKNLNGEQLDLISPVTGAVLRLIQESEAVVAAGTPLVEVGDPRALEVVVDVLTRDAVHIRPGSRVAIDRWGGDASLAGSVRRVEPSAFTRISALGVEEQRVNVLVDFDDPYERWSSLGDGFRVEVDIATWRGEDILQVPASAVFRHKDTWAVYTVEDDTAHLTPVEIGRQNEAAVQITGGLDAGAMVIRHPSDRVSDGASVTERPD